MQMQQCFRRVAAQLAWRSQLSAALRLAADRAVRCTARECLTLESGSACAVQPGGRYLVPSWWLTCLHGIWTDFNIIAMQGAQSGGATTDLKGRPGCYQCAGAHMSSALCSGLTSM